MLYFINILILFILLIPKVLWLHYSTGGSFKSFRCCIVLYCIVLYCINITIVIILLILMVQWLNYGPVGSFKSLRCCIVLHQHNNFDHSIRNYISVVELFSWM